MRQCVDSYVANNDQCYDKNNNDINAADSENKNNDVDGNIDSRNVYGDYGVDDEEDIEIDNRVDVSLNSINTETENTYTTKAVITEKQNLFDDDVDLEEVLQSSSFLFDGYFNPSNKKRKGFDQTNVDFDDSKSSYTQSVLIKEAVVLEMDFALDFPTLAIANFGILIDETIIYVF